MFLTRGDRAVLADMVEQEIRRKLEEGWPEPEFLPSILKKLKEPVKWTENEGDGNEVWLECPSEAVVCPLCGTDVAAPDEWYWDNGYFSTDCPNPECRTQLQALGTVWCVWAMEEGK